MKLVLFSTVGSFLFSIFLPTLVAGDNISNNPLVESFVHSPTFVPLLNNREDAKLVNDTALNNFKKHIILEKILRPPIINSSIIEASTPYTIAQQLTCGKTVLNVVGIFPSQGSELGGTPVAIAVEAKGLEVGANDENDEEFKSLFDPSAYKCDFGETTRPIAERVEEDAQLQKMLPADDVMSSPNALPESNFELLVCTSPPFPVLGEIPGSISFSISCGANDKTNSDTRAISQSAQTNLEFQYTFAVSVHSIYPQQPLR